MLDLLSSTLAYCELEDVTWSRLLLLEFLLRRGGGGGGTIGRLLLETEEERDGVSVISGGSGRSEDGEDGSGLASDREVLPDPGLRLGGGGGTRDGLVSGGGSRSEDVLPETGTFVGVAPSCLVVDLSMFLESLRSGASVSLVLVLCRGGGGGTGFGLIFEGAGVVSRFGVKLANGTVSGVLLAPIDLPCL